MSGNIVLKEVFTEEELQSKKRPPTVSKLSDGHGLLPYSFTGCHSVQD